MSESFRIVALPRETFLPLFDLDDAALAARGVRRQVVAESPGTPCRVSLEDALPGERVLLLPFTHHDVDSPYRASGPIYVRERAATAHLPEGVVPTMLERRLLSVRAYDGGGMLVESDVLPGAELRGGIHRFFARPDVAYLHVHNARPGCYNCKVVRD